MSESYVTTAIDDISCLGCLVLCNSLKKTGTEKKLSVLVNENVSEHLINVLQKSFDYVFFTKKLFLSNKSESSLNKFEHSEKLKCWLLCQFTKCIFLESDILVVENIDDLFERLELSAASDPRWPDYFDIGVFVYEPSQFTYSSLIDFSSKNKFQNNSIQCLLNSFFNKWNILDIDHKIPFTYNCQMNFTFYTHTNALLYFGRSIKAARLGNSVMQMMQPTTLHDSNYDHWNKLWLNWWKIFNEMVKPALIDNQARQFNRISYEKCDFDNWKENYTEKDNSHLNINKENKNIHIRNKHPNFDNICGTSNKLGGREYLENFSHLDYNSASENIFQSQVNDVADIQYQTVIEDTLNTSKESHVYFLSDNNNQQIEIETKELYILEDSIEMKKHQNEFIEESFQCILPLCQNIDEIKNDNIPSNNVETECFLKDTESVITPEVKEETDNDHRQQWERGEIDYMGKDSFQNILLQLNSFIIEKQNISKLQLEE